MNMKDGFKESAPNVRAAFKPVKPSRVTAVGRAAWSIFVLVVVAAILGPPIIWAWRWALGLL